MEKIIAVTGDVIHYPDIVKTAGFKICMIK